MLKVTSRLSTPTVCGAPVIRKLCTWRGLPLLAPSGPYSTVTIAPGAIFWM